MKNQFKIEIETPCSENFNQFKPTNFGGYCGSCNKEVIDFSKMTSQEVIYYFKNNHSKNTCGKFNKQQLTTYVEKPIQRTKYHLLGTFGLALLSFFSFNTAQAQETNSTKNNINLKKQDSNINVKGVVSDESGPLPGVNILLQGTSIGVETDFNGYFNFPDTLKKGAVLIFSFIGLESKKITIQNNKSVANIELKVNMKSDSSILMGKVAVKKIYSSKNKS